MAPRFKQNMYQTYKKDTGVDALICFARWDKVILKFRDHLFNKIGKSNEFFLDKSEGEPTPIDSNLRLFAKDCEDRVRDFNGKKIPNIFAVIFNRRKVKGYFEEAKQIARLASFDVSTSHDHPCIEIYSSLHSEEELSHLIDNVATELNIEMLKNCNLPSIENILYTNRSFDINKE